MITYFTAIILVTISIGLTVMYYQPLLRTVRRDRELYRDMWQEKCKELKKALGEIRRLGLRLDNRNRGVVFQVSIVEDLDVGIGRAEIIGIDEFYSEVSFPIKRFVYDLNDPEEKEFAIREAEELKEVIEKW